MELMPLRATSMAPGPAHITTRTFSISATPMPEDVRSTIVRFFKVSGISEEDLEVVYQYVLSKSESSELNDIELALHDLSNKLQLTSDQMFTRVKDLAIKELQNDNPIEQNAFKKDVIEKEIPLLEKQAQQTGDWRHYLRGVEKKEQLSDEIIDIIG